MPTTFAPPVKKTFLERVPLLGIVGGMFGQRKTANRELERVLSQDTHYTENPLARQRLGLAQTLLNARSPGAVTAERNIYTNQANQLGRLDRSATDASQALSVASGIGANTSGQFQDLQQQEQNDYQRRYGNFVNAQEGVINEGDKLYNDEVRRYGNFAQVRGAQQENNANGWRDGLNLVTSLASMGMSGGISSLFGGGGGGQTNRQVTNGLQSGGINRGWLDAAPLPRRY